MHFDEMMQNKPNRRKGLSEYYDMKRLTYSNPNKDHQAAISQNEGLFKRKNGQFTNLYNSAARFGESKPFKA